MGGKMRGIAFKASRELGLPRGPASWLLAFLLAAGGAPAFAQQETAACAPVIARIVSLQGSVEVQRAGTAIWVGIRRLDTSICAGDRLRTASSSRAALFVQPETLVRLDQNTSLTLQQSTDEISVEFSPDEVSRVACSEQTCGAGYFITRFPKKFKVKTPHMNAAVEGTEFMVAVGRDSTQLTVLEGKVTSESVATGDRKLVEAGHGLASGTAGAGVITATVKPEDAVQWVLRYPPISDQSAASGITAAEKQLRAGSVDAALQAVEAELAGNPLSSDAHALRSVIQVAKNDKAAAVQSARKATELDAASFRGWLALSYAQQAQFDLEAALESARKAESLRGDSPLAHARVAELLLSIGDPRSAEDAARAAIATDPAESHAHSMLGFIHLAQIDTSAARSDFAAAIERDSFSALPRLGLGLAKIRDGELVAGREELEVAVALDPSNSLLRSYVGKAYYEENTRSRNGLAATQYSLAVSLDPLDPTPYFYEAVLKQSENRPVAALESLESAASNNDNRAVYRSRLLIDDDAASQGATIAAIYGDLGFERLEINKSARSLAVNPGNSAAHRELAAAYMNIPRHDIARVSEALQAQIRQPVSIAPVPAALGTDSVLVLEDVGPTQVGTQEFNQLFNGNDFEVTAEASAGGRDTFGGQLVLSGLADRLAYSLSAIDNESDGFIENDAASKSVYDLFVQGQLQPKSTMQVDIKRSEIEVGQTSYPFDPVFGLPQTISEESDSFRVSGHWNARPQVDWIWTAVYEDRLRDFSSFPDGSFQFGSESDVYAVEIQNLLRLGDWQLVSGAGYVDEEALFSEVIDLSTTAENLYAYGQWRSKSNDLALQIGLSLESFELENSVFEDPIDKDRLNPRIGLVWSPRAGTDIRAAFGSTLKRPFVRSQTIEPTQVAGFNQYFTGFDLFFGDPEGTVSERLGVALDQAFPNGVNAGIEISRRDLTVAGFLEDHDWKEESALAYAYKPFLAGSWEGAISLDVEYEAIERPAENTGPEGILDLETIRIPLALRMFSARGVALRARATYVRQQGEFTIQPGDPVFPKDDDAVIVDFALEYLLPRRKGTVSVGVNNAFDEFVDLLEIDPLNPRVATRQLAFARVRLDF
jgi:Tfp pilus assembly protein PilF